MRGRGHPFLFVLCVALLIGAVLAGAWLWVLPLAWVSVRLVLR